MSWLELIVGVLQLVVLGFMIKSYRLQHQFLEEQVKIKNKRKTDLEHLAQGLGPRKKVVV